MLDLRTEVIDLLPEVLDLLPDGVAKWKVGQISGRMAATAPALRRPALTLPPRRAALGKAEEGKCEKHARMLKTHFAISVYHVHALVIHYVPARAVSSRDKILSAATPTSSTT